MPVKGDNQKMMASLGSREIGARSDWLKWVARRKEDICQKRDLILTSITSNLFVGSKKRSPKSTNG